MQFDTRNSDKDFTSGKSALELEFIEFGKDVEKHLLDEMALRDVTDIATVEHESILSERAKVEFLDLFSKERRKYEKSIFEHLRKVERLSLTIATKRKTVFASSIELRQKKSDLLSSLKSLLGTPKPSNYPWYWTTHRKKSSNA